MPPDESMQHGKTVTGTDAACSVKTQSRIVDCVSCIESTLSEFVALLDGEQQELARNIFDRARASSESGTSKSHYLVCLALRRHSLSC
jgi:oxalate---CoA ligase